MRIRYPWSFFTMIVAMFILAALSVSFSVVHVIGLLIGCALIWLTRVLAHWEIDDTNLVNQARHHFERLPKEDSHD